MLELKNVNKYYGHKRALSDITLSLPRGEIVGLFGENGAGKTTLMKSILAYHSFSGEITLDGDPITKNNIAKISFATSEHSFFSNLSADAHKTFYQEHFPKFSEKRFVALMDFFDLRHHTPLRSFSMGQKNQFEVIMALCQGADYILMDEPFAGNDVFNREDFYKVLLGILEPNETLLLSTHLIEEVSDIIGRAVLLKQGCIVGDITTEALEESGKTLMDYIKETHRYRSDRVSRALNDLRGEDSQ
ncbi:MAG: ABC transporter ATP-binding protein [Clostridia bacterium]|nr:ABC transporter ATP-binding protein [Clostridia bacterium]